MKSPFLTILCLLIIAFSSSSKVYNFQLITMVETSYLTYDGKEVTISVSHDFGDSKTQIAKFPVDDVYMYDLFTIFFANNTTGDEAYVHTDSFDGWASEIGFTSKNNKWTSAECDMFSSSTNFDFESLARKLIADKGYLEINERLHKNAPIPILENIDIISDTTGLSIQCPDFDNVYRNVRELPDNYAAFYVISKCCCLDFASIEITADERWGYFPALGDGLLLITDNVEENWRINYALNLLPEKYLVAKIIKDSNIDDSATVSYYYYDESGSDDPIVLVVTYSDEFTTVASFTKPKIEGLKSLFFLE